MKKSLMFVAVAATGMLASCSSDSLTAGPDPNIEPTQEERVPIQLSVSSPSVRANTRGTGTVGGVGVADDDPTNVWHGQKINVFMFTKDANKATTLNLTPLDPEHPEAGNYYENAEMITPGTGNLTPTGSTSTNIGEAMLTDGTIQYYPPTGNYDFFGYHVDDAPGALDKTADPWTVSFTIDGSQDLMSTKAALTGGQETTMATLNDPKDFYSAKSARKLVQPVLSFNHLLSRLSFVIIPGNDNAGGWEITATYTAGEAVTYNATLDGHVAAGDATPADYAEKVGTPAAGTTLTDDEAAAYNAKLEGAVAAGDPKDGVQHPEKAVYVQAIKVLSKRTGKMDVAWTGDTPEDLITWDVENPDPEDEDNWLPLKDRPDYYETAHATNTISTAAYNELAAVTSYYKINDHSIIIDQATYDGKTAEEKAEYEIANTCKAAYNPVGADVANYNLTDITPTYPVMTHAYNPKALQPTPIGEALIVAPSTEDYLMEVKLTQKVPTNWNTPAVLTEKTMTYPLTIKAPDGGFKKNISYQVNLTVYGFERIVVTTEIKPWNTGAEINVGQD